MPRIRQNADQYRTDDFLKAVAHCRIDVGALYLKDIAEEADIPNTTLCKRLKDPDSFTLSEFRRFLGPVPLPPGAVLNFLGYSQKDIRKFMKAETLTDSASSL